MDLKKTELRNTNYEPLAIVGPTASGKSDLALKMAMTYQGEIIAADSRTIYKGMNIGTAKPSLQDQKLVPHHCLDIITPDQKFSASEFKHLANTAIIDIQSRGKLPIMVGGSGLYIDSVLFDYQFSEFSAERDPQNPRHLKKTEQLSRPKKLIPNTLVIGLCVPKEVLHERIEQRIDAMLAAGLLQEVQNLLKTYKLEAPGMLAPGYKEFSRYLRGQVSFEEAKNQFIKSHKQLAKRQMTWFKRNKNIQWFASGEEAFKFFEHKMR